MRLKSPRIAPLSDEEAWSEKQASVLDRMAARGPILNVFRTLAQDGDVITAFMPWGRYILSARNGIPAREKEIAILRTGYLCRSGYEFTQHTRIGLEAGLTEAEIAAIKVGPSAPQWGELDRLILQASDELFHDRFVATPTWEALGRHYSRKQQMDLVLTIGQYTQVSMFLNSFGVQLDPGQTLDPDLAAYEA